jgi:hypothetical protein
MTLPTALSKGTSLYFNNMLFVVAYDESEEGALDDLPLMKGLAEHVDDRDGIDVVEGERSSPNNISPSLLPNLFVINPKIMS